MTKDQQIRLLCEQQDQLNEEARKQKAEVSRLKAELASCQGLLDRSIAELAARTEERAELAAALAFAVECARAAGYTGTLREPPVALAAVKARAKAEGLREAAETFSLESQPFKLWHPHDVADELDRMAAQGEGKSPA